MKNDTHEMRVAKLLDAQEKPFTVFSPHEWRENYRKTRRAKLFSFDKFLVVAGIVSVLVFCIVNQY